MLLSFPLDPDPATGEIISEMIYANSTTLDGRRFANEFIAKRKADAASRPKGGNADWHTGAANVNSRCRENPTKANSERVGFQGGEQKEERRPRLSILECA